MRFDGRERCWTRIDGPAGVDVWVLTWLTFQGTDLHDHGRSSAAFTVVRGALHEIRPGADGRLRPRKFVPGVVATIEPGQVHDVAQRAGRARGEHPRVRAPARPR